MIDLFRDEQGLTTVSMVLALLISLSLIFTAGQVCLLQGRASRIQNVADAAALAAENDVAEFMIAVRVCDAVVLTLSLSSLVATGLGVVALCVPPAEAFAEPLLEAGQKLASARNTFSDKASLALDKYQTVLPFIAAADAAAVAAANNEDGSSYLALAVLAPQKAESIVVEEDEDAAQANDFAQENADELSAAAEEAENAAERANEAKKEGFMHDCGNNPSYCMYQRAATLAGMSGSSNPLYHSVDTWSFSVALKRAKSYYPRRLSQEAPADGSVAEQARSALRKNFYRYAVQEVSKGYVNESDSSFSAYFPMLPRNTAEMRQTSLYTQVVYPCSCNESGELVMHAWSGCPQIASVESYGSIAQMEAGAYPVCEACGFRASSMGSVASASTSIQNGFEYHYQRVAEAAAAYEKARSELSPLKEKVQGRVDEIFDSVLEGLKEAVDKRIEAQPPGSKGVVVLAADLSSYAPAESFPSAFVQSSASLGACAAVSAATLLEEPAGEGSNIIASLLDGVEEKAGSRLGVAGLVLDCWAKLLDAYCAGQEAIDEAVSSSLDNIPLASASGLGDWASGRLKEVVESLGLQPAQLDALKPVLVNSVHVSQKDESGFGARLVGVRQVIIANPLASNDLFSSLLTLVEQRVQDSISSGKISIATIDLSGFGGGSIPLEVTLPQAAKDAASSLMSDLVGSLRGLYARVVGIRVWE